MRKRLSRLLDRWWWWSNRKPSSPLSTYLATHIPWIMVGLAWASGLLLLEWGQEALAIFLVLLALLLAVITYRADKKEGYLEATHKAYLRKREEVGKRLGKI